MPQSKRNPRPRPGTYYRGPDAVRPSPLAIIIAQPNAVPGGRDTRAANLPGTRAANHAGGRTPPGRAAHDAGMQLGAAHGQMPRTQGRQQAQRATLVGEQSDERVATRRTTPARRISERIAARSARVAGSRRAGEPPGAGSPCAAWAEGQGMRLNIVAPARRR